jgi:hypothetical protein
MIHDPREESAGRTWFTVFFLVVMILAVNGFVYFAVGDRGPGPWNYGAVGFVPGESPYSTAKTPTDMWKP